MNRTLMENIVRHVFANLAIIPSAFVNIDKTKSLMSKDFVLNDTLSFEGCVVKNKIWGCQVLAEQQELKILLGDCSQERQTPEYCLVVQLKDAPAYGIYLVCNSNGEDSEPLIACTLNGKEWMECQTYLQATFLAGMEQIRDIGLTWSKCTNYKDQYDLMISFIDFHSAVYEAKYAGQEV
jgi:hypothetical protein